MPRRATRLFPAVGLINVATGDVIADTRVTFTGQRGLVVCGWLPLLTVNVSVDRLLVGVNIVGTALIGLPLPGATSSGLEVSGKRFAAWSWVVIQDPPEESFVELELAVNVGTIQIPINSGHLIVLAFGVEVGAGPVVDVG